MIEKELTEKLIPIAIGMPAPMVLLIVGVPIAIGKVVADFN